MYIIKSYISCRFHFQSAAYFTTAELIPEITRRFGIDYMANVGGAIHEHPEGMRAGAQKLRDAIDKVKQ